MSLAVPGGGQNLVWGKLFCIPGLVLGKVTWEIDLWPEC
jgi:hypothetical protein